MISLFIIDDEEQIRESLAELFSNPDYDVAAYDSGEAALADIYRDRPDIILLDIQLPGIDGLELLKKIKTDLPDIEVIMITGYADVNSAVTAMKLGARDYIKKPFDFEELALLVGKTCEVKKKSDQLAYLQQEQQSEFSQIIGSSKSMKQVYGFIKQIAKSPRTTVLITGETGTGKGLVARAIHYSSIRAENPFVEINCSAFQPNLLESELFGYEAGAFTGAKQRKKGLLELAHTGTFFLDEIGDMSTELQAKILKVLEEQTFRRVGGTREIRINTRIISASSKDLMGAVRDGSFRQDLFYRLNVATVELPPLRERGDDIIALARHFISVYNKEFNKAILGIGENAVTAMLNYPWVGNVRELRNLVERAVLFEDGNYISISSLGLPDQNLATNDSTRPITKEGIVEIPDHNFSLDQLEKEVITLVLRQNGGNQTAAARHLGITRETLKYRLKKYSIKSSI